MSTSDNICENLESCKLDVEKKISDEELFKQPPAEDCPICFLRMPMLNPTGNKYKTCCGKTICSGCIHAPVYDDRGNKVDNKKCPFCRAPPAYTDEEGLKRTKNRIEAGDSRAMHNLGYYYFDGSYGFTQDYTKALDLYHRAGELGLSNAYTSIGNAYYYGRGVEVDMKKARHYTELAAMKGSEVARHNLGCIEKDAGNIDRAQKHYMIAIRGGYSNSLKEIQNLYTNGHATKEEYTKALQLYQAYLGEIKSEQRDQAAAFNSEKYRYY